MDVPWMSWDKVGFEDIEARSVSWQAAEGWKQEGKQGNGEMSL